MPLTVDVHAITAVLLPDGWYQIDDQTFTLHPFYRAPAEDEHGIPIDITDGAPYVDGFAFRNSGTWVAGPLGSVRAVRYD